MSESTHEPEHDQAESLGGDAHADACEPAPSAVRNDRRAQKKSRAIRLGVLVASLAAITAIGILHQKGGAAFKTVGVDALCPFGGIEAFWSLITKGALLQRIATSSVVLLGVVLVTAVLFRRVFCGYVCPLGALQELFGKIGRALWSKRRPELPASLDRPARLLKYLVLAFFTVATWRAAELVIRPYDPWVAYMHLTSGELFTEFGIGLAVLGVSLAGSIVYERFFCKYLCPMGAFLGLLSPLSLFKVRRNAEGCTSCSACDKACPVNIQVSTAEVVKDPECINCNECVNVCPVAGVLEVSTAGSGAKGRAGRQVLRPNQALLATLALIAVFLGVTTFAGSFKWMMPSAAEASAATAAGATFDPETIKGYMSFAEIASAVGISPMVFEQRFGVSPGDMTKPIKDLAPQYGFDVHTDVREFVSQKVSEAQAAAATGASGTSATGEAAGASTGED